MENSIPTHLPKTNAKRFENDTCGENRKPAALLVHNKFRNFVTIDSLSNSRSFADLLGKFGTSRAKVSRFTHRLNLVTVCDG